MAELQNPNNARVVAEVLAGHGFSKVQAAGIIGHLIVESGIRPTGAVGDAGTAFGVAQWRHSRFDELEAFAEDRGTTWEDLETQAHFIVEELNSTELRAMNALKRSDTVEEATESFVHFERPFGYTPSAPEQAMHFDRRLKNAEIAYADENGVFAGIQFSSAPMVSELPSQRPNRVAPQTPDDVSELYAEADVPATAPELLTTEMASRGEAPVSPSDLVYASAQEAPAPAGPLQLTVSPAAQPEPAQPEIIQASADPLTDLAYRLFGREAPAHHDEPAFVDARAPDASLYPAILEVAHNTQQPEALIADANEVIGSHFASVVLIGPQGGEASALQLSFNEKITSQVDQLLAVECLLATHSVIEVAGARSELGDGSVDLMIESSSELDPQACTMDDVRAPAALASLPSQGAGRGQG